MNRRAFITLPGGAAAWPRAAWTQQPALPVIGYLSGRSPEAEAPIVAAGRRGLQEIGYLAGQNIAIEFRFSDGQDHQLPALAADLVGRRVAVLVATDRPSAVAAKAATATIPIVFTSGADAAELGLVASLNRPGGNATGVNIFTIELGPKRLELLRQLLPNPGTIAFMVNPNSADHRAAGERAADGGCSAWTANPCAERRQRTGDRRSLRDHRRTPRCCRPLCSQ